MIKSNNKYIFNTRLDLARNILPKDAIGCEIGVGGGDYAQCLFNETKPKYLYLIDRWLYMPDKDPTVYGWKCKHSQKDYDTYYKQTLSRFHDNNNVIIIRQSSIEALNTFINDFFDYIYIDGSHDYDSVKQDLELARIKTKKNGFICGHDYNQNFNRNKKNEYGVIKAVNEFVIKYGLKIDITIQDHKGKSYILYE
jgi:hypothetical protein